MKMLLAIGNSQIGALKKGFREVSNKKFIAHFWSIPGGRGPRLDLDVNGDLLGDERVLADCLSESTDSLIIKDYDFILLSGVGIPAIRRSNNTLHRHSVPAGLVDCSNMARLKRSLISKNCYAEIVKSSIKTYPSFQNIEKIRKHYSGRLMVQMFPLPAKQVLSKERYDMGVYGDHALSFLAWYYKIQESVLLKECKRLGAELIKYPSNWMDSGLTPDQYSTKDAWHMNAEFGKFFFENSIDGLV